MSPGLGCMRSLVLSPAPINKPILRGQTDLQKQSSGPEFIHKCSAAAETEKWLAMKRVIKTTDKLIK